MTTPSCPLAALDEKDPAPELALFMPTLIGGGAEQINITLAEYFSSRGLTVDLIVCKNFGSLQDRVPAGVRLVDLSVRKVALSLPAYLRYLRVARPPVVLSAVDNTNIISCLGRMASSHRHRLVVRLDGSLIEKNILAQSFSRWVTLAAAALTFPAADALVGVSNGLCRQMAALTRWFPGTSKSISCIYNPVIKDDFPARLAESVEFPASVRADIPIVLAAGRLHPIKDYGTLLRAFAIAARQVPAQLVILGEGDERENLENLAGSLGIADRTTFVGFVRNPFPYMRRAQTFVLSSIMEGLSSVLIEALAAGASVVSTDCPHGPREVLGDGRFGTLVPIGNAEALAQAIVAGLCEPRPRPTTELAAHLQLFKVDHVAEQYIDVLGLRQVIDAQRMFVIGESVAHGGSRHI